MVILLCVIMSSSYFINSIVTPVGEIGTTARKIAQGEFGTRLKRKTTMRLAIFAMSSTTWRKSSAPVKS